MTEENNRTYLGDGVYVNWDGYHIVLVTNDGIGDRDRIFLDPNVWDRLKKWAKKEAAHEG